MYKLRELIGLSLSLTCTIEILSVSDTSTCWWMWSAISASSLSRIAGFNDLTLSQNLLTLWLTQSPSRPTVLSALLSLMWEEFHDDCYSLPIVAVVYVGGNVHELVIHVVFVAKIMHKHFVPKMHAYTTHIMPQSAKFL